MIEWDALAYGFTMAFAFSLFAVLPLSIWWCFKDEPWNDPPEE